MNSFLQKKLSPIVTVFYIAVLFGGSTLWTDDAYAHKGHAGKKVTFLKKKAVLKALLPADGKVYRRKQRLDSEQAEWAENNYGVALKTKVHAFYVSKIRSTKKINGSAILYKFAYRHGYGEVAVGIDNNNQLTKVAFVSINEKYLVDFEDTIGSGFLASYENMTINDLIEKTRQNSSADKATREFTNALRDAVITLLAFQN